MRTIYQWRIQDFMVGEDAFPSHFPLPSLFPFPFLLPFPFPLLFPLSSLSVSLFFPFPYSPFPFLLFQPFLYIPSASLPWNSVKGTGGALGLLQRGPGRSLSLQRIWGTLKLEKAINGINFGLFSSTKEVKLTSQCTSQSPDKHTGL